MKPTPLRHIACPALAEPPHATWSNALRIGQELILSGQTAHPASRDAALAGRPLGVFEQTLVALQKIESLLLAAGGGRHSILKLTVYLTDIADKDEVGRARREFFADTTVFPASTLVAVGALAFPELLVEVDALARLDADLRQAGRGSHETASRPA